MVQVTGLWTYPAATNSCVADGKPFKVIEVSLDAEADIAPLKLGYPSGVTATKFDLGQAAGNGHWAQSIVGVFDIPADYPGRNMWDKATAWSASDTKVPWVECEFGRDYYITTATDMTNYNQGQSLVAAADGDLAKAADESPDACILKGPQFQLRYAVSTTEIVVRFMGWGLHDGS
jgi:hypothetical protein